MDNIKNEDLINLIARCSIKDQRAFKQLFEQVGSYLNAVAFRIVKSEALSNEVLQEAFIQIWNNASSYRQDIAKPLTWMTSIVRYRALDILEKEKKHQNTVSGELHDVLENISDEGDLEQASMDEQLRGLLQDCMEGLNEKARKSVSLAYLEGYSREEIAQRLATKVNTVKSWLHRSAERLKQCLEGKMTS